MKTDVAIFTGFAIGLVSGVLFATWLTAKITRLPEGLPPPVHMTLGSPNGLTNAEYSCQPLQQEQPK